MWSKQWLIYLTCRKKKCNFISNARLEFFSLDLDQNSKNEDWSQWNKYDIFCTSFHIKKSRCKCIFAQKDKVLQSPSSVFSHHHYQRRSTLLAKNAKDLLGGDLPMIRLCQVSKLLSSLSFGDIICLSKVQFISVCDETHYFIARFCKSLLSTTTAIVFLLQ